MSQNPEGSEIRELLDDVFFVLQFVSEQLYRDVMDYFMAEDDALPVPRASSSELAVIPGLLVPTVPEYHESTLKHALALFRPDWYVHTHQAARARLHDRFALMDSEGDRIILRFSRVLASLRPFTQREPLVPGSIASLIDHSTVSFRGIQSMPHPAMPVAQLRRLLEAEGFSSRESRVTMVELLLNHKNSLARSLAMRVRDMPDAIEFLLESKAVVLAVLDGLDPDEVDLVLNLAERDPRIAALTAPRLARAVVNGRNWQRERLRTVLRSTPVAAYRDEAATLLRSCNTGRLPRAISIAEKFEDAAAGAALLQQAREQTSSAARRRLLDAAVDRMASYAFASLAFDPPAIMPRAPITDSALSPNQVETLRAALVNRRKRAITYAKAREKNLDSPWHASSQKEYMDGALLVVEKCDALLQDVDSLALALGGRGPLPQIDPVIDETLLKHLSGFTIAQRLRLVSEGGNFPWWKLRHHLPLPGVTAQDIVDFGETLGLNPTDVGLSLLRTVLTGWDATFVVHPAGMWPVAENHLLELDNIFGLAVDSDHYRFAVAVRAAVEIFASSPKPLPQYLASITALTRSHSKFVKEAAVAALERYHLAS